MGIISGYLCLLCFCLIAGKWLTRKCNLQKADEILKRLHKPACIVFAALCILHVVYAAPAMKYVNKLVNLTGKVSFLAMLALIVMVFAIKDKPKKIFWHQIMTAVMAIGIVLHTFLSILS